MSVFRIEKNKNYTVMSNHHLRNKDLSLKSKGLLSLMLSLPEEWDYTLKGLSIICKEGIDAIRVSIIELEKQGYIERRRNRNTKGQLTNTEYIIHEYPITVTPKSEQPMQAKPTLESPTQINKDKTIKEELNTDCIKYQYREILRTLCRYKGVEIIEGEVCPDHIHMLVAIPSKMSVSGFMGYLKGKSSLMIFQKWGNMKFAYRNREFWCKGYYVDTVGKDTKAIKAYIENQLKVDKETDQLSMFDPRDPFMGSK